MRRGLSVGSISCEVISGQMSWPGAGAAAGSSHELHFTPPGWYSAPKAMRIIPHCARMGSPAQICRWIARQKNVVCNGVCQL